jgi:hypothetical protein
MYGKSDHGSAFLCTVWDLAKKQSGGSAGEDAYSVIERLV